MKITIPSDNLIVELNEFNYNKKELQFYLTQSDISNHLAKTIISYDANDETLIDLLTESLKEINQNEYKFMEDKSNKIGTLIMHRPTYQYHVALRLYAGKCYNAVNIFRWNEYGFDCLN